jgi:hypothetical protein
MTNCAFWCAEHYQKVSSERPLRSRLLHDAAHHVTGALCHNRSVGSLEQSSSGVRKADVVPGGTPLMKPDLNQKDSLVVRYVHKRI